MIPARPISIRMRFGFTLVELLLGLALTAIVGATSVAMLVALSTGVDAERDTRQASVKRQSTILRLGTLTRSSARVLAADANALVFWLHDGNGNGKPDTSELRRLHWDSVSQVVSSFEAPPDLDPASDATYDLNADFGAITAALCGSSTFPGTIALQSVTQWSVQLDSPSVQSARLIRLTVSIDHESGSDAAVLVAMPHAAAD